MSCLRYKFAWIISTVAPPFDIASKSDLAVANLLPLLPKITTLIPLAISCLAVANPIPLEPPTISAMFEVCIINYLGYVKLCGEFNGN